MTLAPRGLVRRFRARELKRALASELTTSSSSVAVTNPFLPYFNEVTGCWAPPRYSLRRQAELVKKGQIEGTLGFLPLGPKFKPPLEILTPKPTAKSVRVVSKTTGVGSGDKPTINIATRIRWIGELKNRDVAGTDVGNRLYGGKKQMFKGHRWERVVKRRRFYQRILMRSMKRRILRWRLHHVQRNPWPLSRIRKGNSRKPKKLPF